jgi:hypothetical protein
MENERRFVQWYVLDRMDDRNPEVPPQFACEACGGEMYPEYDKGVHGYEYRLEDRTGKKEGTESLKEA